MSQSKLLTLITESAAPPGAFLSIASRNIFQRVVFLHQPRRVVQRLCHVVYDREQRAGVLHARGRHLVRGAGPGDGGCTSSYGGGGELGGRSNPESVDDSEV